MHFWYYLKYSSQYERHKDMFLFPPESFAVVAVECLLYLECIFVSAIILLFSIWMLTGARVISSTVHSEQLCR